MEYGPSVQKCLLQEIKKELSYAGSLQKQGGINSSHIKRPANRTDLGSNPLSNFLGVKQCSFREGIPVLDDTRPSFCHWWSIGAHMGTYKLKVQSGHGRTGKAHGVNSTSRRA